MATPTMDGLAAALGTPATWLAGAALALLLAAAGEPARAAGEGAATILVATADSGPASRAAAAFVGDGQGDQEEINAAVRALPPAGGTVLLAEGTYDIRRVQGALGGVIINRSHVVLAGRGPATRLVQAPHQNTNVIRIIGSGVGWVTIRDLAVDASRDQNDEGTGDPNLSHDRFEFCGIKAFFRAPRDPSPGEPNHDITIRSCRVADAHSLGIMLEGRNMRVLDNVIGNATSDAVEILTGPGEIRGNYLEITGRTHVAVGTDRADAIIMAGNTVHVRPTGDLDIGFRSWAGSRGHVITGNVLTVDPGGKCALAMDIRGAAATITGNSLHTANPDQPLRLLVTAGNVVITGNVCERVVIEVNDRSDPALPIIVTGNVLSESRLEYKAGRLVTGGE